MKRNHIFDILRIIAIMAIIIHHIIINDVELFGNINGIIDSLSNKQMIVCILINSFSVIGVNLFFLLSGYFGIKYNIRKALCLILEILIIYLIVTSIGIVTGYVSLDKDTIISIINPFTKYWFLYVYIIILFLSPIINKFIKCMDKGDFKRLIIITILLFSIYSLVNDTNLNIGGGYSLIWGVLMYIIGGLINRFKYANNKGLLVYFICSVINAIIICLLCFYNQRLIAWRMFSYNNIFVFLSSLGLVAYFNSIKKQIKNEKAIKVITFLASNTLVVYLLHSTCFLTVFRKMPIQLLLNQLGFVWTILFIPIYAFIILVICSFISEIYNYTFGKIIKKILD